MRRRILTDSEAEWIAQYVEHYMPSINISKRNKLIVIMRYGRHMTSAKIAQLFGISTQRVNQICNWVLDRVQWYSKSRVIILK